MTEHSQNGWPASEHLPLRPLVVNGVSFSPGIRDDDDVETVLRYVIEQYAQHVEPLGAGCWGYFYRPNRNDPDSLSNHASGTAVDINAPQHPNGVPTWRTFSAEQQAKCHAILVDLDGAVRWGGDYLKTADAMHWEVVCGPETLHAVAEKLRGDEVSPEDIDKIAEAVTQKLLATPVGNDDTTVRQVLNKLKTWLGRQ